MSLHNNKIPFFENPTLIFIFSTLDFSLFEETHALSTLGIASNIFKRLIFVMDFKQYFISGYKIEKYEK